MDKLKKRCSRVERYVISHSASIREAIESKNEAEGEIEVFVAARDGISPRTVTPYLADSLTRHIGGYSFKVVSSVPNPAYGEAVTLKYKRR